MADNSTNNNAVSKTSADMPQYLDYNALRADSIDYLGNLTGKIWTDYNEHDPGITILEMLCYAMLDLDYRTKFPIGDILSRSPDDTSADNNFFTPADILGCNPLTIMDYRKLLIDIEGVRNAWLEIDQNNNPRTLCKESRQRISSPCEDGTVEFVNGLYHICIELDDGYETKAKKQKVLENVKKALYSYRNLCEDFVDIFVLCRLKIGVCADIELELNADPEAVYDAMILALQNFFSPSPKFYKLTDLLGKPKCKHIEDIYAGRPINLTQSHGFVDVDEFEQIQLKKEIHLSDVYNAIKVAGIKTVRQLSLQKCEDNKITQLPGWKVQLPENYVPAFSLSCSGFRFTQNNKIVQVDFKKFEQDFNLNSAANTKVLYQQPSPYLDEEIPRGTYRGDLGDYFSIQNEFPRTYGIASGGLPGNATMLRQAQALQLKGYLLFFDQLLADYLVQLKNIRQLFSFSAPASQMQSQTYFLGQLSSVPDVNKLLRFSVDDNGQTMFGQNGSILGIPVMPKDPSTFPPLDTDDPSIVVDPSKELQDYTFSSPTERDIAIQQLLNDISNGNYGKAIFSTPDGCYFIYVGCSDFGVMSKTLFQKLSDARQSMSNIQYLASFKQNYRSFPTANNKFSFDIEFNAAGYINYLQTILEGKSLYRTRREAFLNHLLARFAEKFTDYALLSYGFLNDNKLTDAEIKNKEAFLTNYPDLSSKRGKAYDYNLNGWDVDNISGFEKRFKALAGIENWKRHSLCNFEVVRCDRHYAIQLRFAGFDIFSTDFMYDEKEEALRDAVLVFKAAGNFSLYNVVAVLHEDHHEIQIQYGKNRLANYVKPVREERKAWEMARNIFRIFSREILPEDIFVSKTVFKQELINETRIVRLSRDFFETEVEAFRSFSKSFKSINDTAKWESPSGPHAIGKLHIALNDDVFVDLRAFKIDINNSIIGKPDIFTYEVLDANNTFKFVSAKEFKSEAGARADSYQLLGLMTDRSNYSIVMDKKTELWKIYVLHGESIQAGCVSLFNSESRAVEFKDEIFEIARKNRYELNILPVSYRWKFRFPLGYDTNNMLFFQSIDEYHSEKHAIEQAEAFAKAIEQIDVAEENEKILLVPTKDSKTPVCEMVAVFGQGQGGEKSLPKKTEEFLTLRKRVSEQYANLNPQDFQECITIDEANKEGEYIYRLVDKDRLIAKSRAVLTEQEARELRNELYSNAEKGYSFLEICLGGDVVIARADKNGVWYHYVIKCRKNMLSLPEESILFESYMGYASEQEAENAFNENYLAILHKALDKSNYGSGKFIGIEETFSEQHNTCIKSDTTVVVPKATYQLLGLHDDEVVRELIKLASSYPVRMAEKPTEMPGTQPRTSNCENIIPTFAYYFVLFNVHELKIDWTSTCSYDSADEARQEFYFFLLLLKYKGNFHIDIDYEDCKPVVYIREVLAESIQRFREEKAAWGEHGIEKFICVAQTCNSFHYYFDRQNCFDSFYIACGNSGIVHPCSYESPEKRNQSLELLFSKGREFVQKNPPHIFFPHDSNIIRDLEGKELAIFLKQDTESNFTNYCNRLMELIDCILDDTKYKQGEEGFFLTGQSTQYLEKIAIPVDKNICLRDWKEKLIELAFYFPIVKNIDANNKKKYCVEIKFPCFNHPGSDLSTNDPCGCNGRKPGNDESCQIAWKSVCCFDTCRDAFEFYYKILPLLLNYQNYHPVYDCDCGPYRIELLARHEIIASNPQSYSTPAMNCEAGERSIKLLNAEGLHLVEHILLRPQCEEDCKCSFYEEHCDDKTHCHFTWEIPGEEDPCLGQKNICFVPGVDPYSFIATIALPAWPARFRRMENRQLLENILYREAPAHVLIRILWLAPHDLCCFETHFKKWNRRLGQKTICADNNPACEFLNFLFETNFECLKDCTECPPCKTDVPPPSPCVILNDHVVKTTGEFEILNQLNELYCWKKMDCKEYKYIECKESKPEIRHRTAEKKEKSREEFREPMEIVLEKNVELSDPESKFVNDRRSSHKYQIEQIIADSDKHELSLSASAFISDDSSSAEQFKALILKILSSKTDQKKNKKGLGSSHKKELVNQIIRNYLDKLVFDKKDISPLKDLKDFFGQLRKKKIATSSIYQEWRPEEVQKYNRSLDTKFIKSILDIK
jgi:hypothetical protein